MKPNLEGHIDHLENFPAGKIMDAVNIRLPSLKDIKIPRMFTTFAIGFLASSLVLSGFYGNVQADESSTISGSTVCGQGDLFPNAVAPAAEFGRTGYDYGIVAYNQQGINTIHQVAGYYSQMVYDSSVGYYKVCYFPIGIDNLKKE
ncbi:MAG: hypothetical protein ACD_12C00636G0004 [uncultured bacterium]|nr:MAG: hypothetical protein ACD_12C00636G0004 [uncultured bacterium]